MRYFDNVEVGEEVFCLIYGKGRIIMALEKEQRVDGFHIFEAEYKKKKVHYTVDGFPSWCSTDGGCQTVFYLHDIDFSEMNIQPTNKVLSKKQIMKHKEKGTLEVRCPSGIWRNVEEAPENIFKKAVKSEKLHIFRKVK